MITIEAYRNNGGGEVLLCTSQVKPLAAVDSLCLMELGYGGSITDITRTSVEVRTDVLGCKDRTVYSGSEDDMLILLPAAVTALKLRSERHEQLVEAAANSLEQLPGKIRGVALYVTNLAPFFLGGPVAKLALIASLDIKETETELLKELCQINNEMLMAIIYLTGIGQSIAEARQTAGSISLRLRQLLQVCNLAYEKELTVEAALGIQQLATRNGEASYYDMDQTINMVMQLAGETGDSPESVIATLAA